MALEIKKIEFIDSNGRKHAIKAEDGQLILVHINILDEEKVGMAHSIAYTKTLEIAADFFFSIYGFEGPVSMVLEIEELIKLVKNMSR